MQVSLWTSLEPGLRRQVEMPCSKEEPWTPKSWPAAKGTRHASGGSSGSCCELMGLPSAACQACQVKPPRPIGLSSFHGRPPGTGSRREPWCGYGLLPWTAARQPRNRIGERRAAVGGPAQLGPSCLPETPLQHFASPGGEMNLFSRRGALAAVLVQFPQQPAPQ